MNFCFHFSLVIMKKTNRFYSPKCVRKLFKFEVYLIETKTKVLQSIPFQLGERGEKGFRGYIGEKGERGNPGFEGMKGERGIKGKR